MAGLTPDQLRFALWFLLAGTILGFSISTLWEWLYFRRKRLSAVEPNRYALAGSLAVADQYELAPAAAAPSGALLDSEQAAGSAGASSAEASASAPPLAPVEQVTGPGRAEIGPAPRHPAPTLVQQVDAAHAARSRGYPDDLTQIAGVTRADQQSLYAAHIYTWHQVATSDAYVLAEVTGAAADADVDRWPARAQALAERHGRINAAYSGPPPDDLTRILGIHAVEAQALHHAGITSYRQLAETPQEELAVLFPEEGRDLEGWLRMARTLARPGSSTTPSTASNGEAA